MAKFEKRVTFTPGFNYLHEEGPHRRGQHGMEIRFSLIGPKGAVQFGLTTGWTPLGVVDQDLPRDRFQGVCHIDTWSEPGVMGIRSGLVRPPSGICVGIHSPVPFDHDPDGDFCSVAACDLLPGACCYFDASYTASDVILKKFIEGGDKAVWKELRRWYKKYFEKESKAAEE